MREVPCTVDEQAASLCCSSLTGASYVPEILSIKAAATVSMYRQEHRRERIEDRLPGKVWFQQQPPKRSWGHGEPTCRVFVQGSNLVLFSRSWKSAMFLGLLKKVKVTYVCPEKNSSSGK